MGTPVNAVFTVLFSRLDFLAEAAVRPGWEKRGSNSEILIRNSRLGYAHVPGPKQQQSVMASISR